MSRSRLRPPGALALGAAVLAIGLAACGGGSSSSATTANAAATGSGNGGSSDQRVKITYVLHLRVPFTQQMADGAEQAAKDANVDLQVVGPQNFDPPSAIQAFENALSSGAQGIAVVPHPGDVWRKPLQEAKEKGVPTISANVGSPGLTDLSPVFVGENSINLGHALGDVILKNLPANPTGSVVVGICSPDLLPLTLRLQGVKEELAQKAPGVKFEGPFETSGDPAKNFQVWQGLVQAHQDALAFIGLCSLDPPSLAKIKAKTPGAKWLVTGTDFEPGTIQGIKDGTVIGAVGQSPFMQGYVPVRMLADVLRKKYAMPTGWIDSGLETLDKSNIDKVAAREASKDLTLQYYKPVVDKLFADPAAAVTTGNPILEKK